MHPDSTSVVESIATTAVAKLTTVVAPVPKGLASALSLAAQGFHVFPLIADAKLPAIEAFPEKATRDPVQLAAWFHCSVFKHDHGHNVGIYTGRYGDDPADSLCVIDVDDKNGKDGSGELAKLVATAGLDLPATYTQTTASGGRHIVYRTTSPVANAVGGTGKTRFPAGLDIRGRGGFIVGAGSRLGAKAYTADGAAVAAAPAALIELCEPYTPPREASPLDPLFAPNVDAAAAEQRAIAYLATAPQSVKGQGGDATAYLVANRLKDIGVSEARCLDLMMSAAWHDGCGWASEKLAVKIANAFHYGRSAPGSAAPETLLRAVDGSADELRKLAALSQFDYARERKAAAKRLGVCLPDLDVAVKAQRPAKANSAMADLFPGVEPWPEPVDAAALLTAVEGVFIEYMTLPPHAASAMALWVLWTYVHDARDTAPILFVSSPTPSCGKSTCMTLVNRMACRPLMVSGMTAATVFRVIEDQAPTLLIDEADSFAKDDEELRGVLNSGHAREGAMVLRVEGDGGDRRVTKFSTWAPKMLAAIGALPGTIESRAIIVRLQRRLVTANAPRLGRRQFTEFRRMATRWAADNEAGLAAFDCPLPEWLSDRAFDSWLPLLAIADAASGGWPERALSAARELSGTGAIDPVAAGGTGVELLRDIREMFADVSGKDSKDSDPKVSSADLIHRLCSDEGARWCEYFRGQRITASQVARLLKPFGIASKGVRMPDGTTPKGYRLAQFGDAFSRYLPARGSEGVSQPPHRNNSTTAGLAAVFNAATDPIVLLQGLPPQANNDVGCGGVAAGKPPMAATVTKTSLADLFG